MMIFEFIRIKKKTYLWYVCYIYSWDRYCCFLTLRRRIYVIIAVYKMNAQKECEAVIHVSTTQKIPERRNNNNFTYISILIRKKFSSDADDGYTKKMVNFK